MVGRVCTRGTERFLRKALEGFGYVGAGMEGVPVRLGAEVYQRTRAPSSWWAVGPFYPVWRAEE